MTAEAELRQRVAVLEGHLRRIDRAVAEAPTPMVLRRHRREWPALHAAINDARKALRGEGG